MVRNTTGGTGHKAQASKYQDKGKNVSAKTRFVKEEGELYAIVTKNLGNGMCHVICQDRVTRLCIVRGKFTGRGKKDNMIASGKWVMVGIRDYESVAEGKQEKCDLLEIYNDLDISRLKSQEKTVDLTVFRDIDCILNRINKSDEQNMEFSDKRTDDYNEILMHAGADGRPIQHSMTEEHFEGVEEEIDVDDI